MSHRSPRRAGVARRAALVLGSFLLAGAGACSGGEEEPPEAPAESEPAPVVEALATTLHTGQVVGRLPERRADAVVERVGDVVDGWIDAGFAGEEWPREISGAYVGFTDRARKQAVGDAELTSAAGFSQQVDAVEVKRRVVRVDVVAHDREPAGATARVRLVLETTGEVERTVRVRGRLFLTPTGDGWKIFGYDLTQGGE